MKKITSVIIALIIALGILSACTNEQTGTIEEANETFASVTDIKYGKVLSKTYSDENCNIKVNDNKFDDFLKYIDDLKADGFEYYQIADIPENIENNNGQASCRGHKDDVYLLVIFSASDTENYKAFGCNIQIFGYSKDPWADVDTKSDKKKDKKDDKKEEKTTAESTTADTKD